MGKSTISITIFKFANCKRLPQGVYIYIYICVCVKITPTVAQNAKVDQLGPLQNPVRFVRHSHVSNDGYYYSMTMSINLGKL